MAGRAQPGKMPSKKCPECGAEVHTRRKQCDCGHIFVSKSQQAAQASAAQQRNKPRPKPRAAAATSLKEQLKQEKAKLQKRLQAIETLLESE